MFANKLKKELLKKVNELKEIEKKMRKIEEENPDLEFEDLEELNDEYCDLEVAWSNISEEINMLLFDTKFFPLCGLASDQIKSIPEGPKHLSDVYKVSDGSKIEGGVYVPNIEAFEKYLDMELVRLKEDMKKRLGLLKTIKIEHEIESRARFLYKQITQCFIFGMFDACCVLCRAIIESITKRYIEFSGYGDYLVGRDKERKVMSILNIMKQLEVPGYLIKEYSIICNKADKILHTRNVSATEKDALSSIESLQAFIEKFPKMV